MKAFNDQLRTFFEVHSCVCRNRKKKTPKNKEWSFGMKKSVAFSEASLVQGVSEGLLVLSVPNGLD